MFPGARPIPYAAIFLPAPPTSIRVAGFGMPARRTGVSASNNGRNSCKRESIPFYWLANGRGPRAAVQRRAFRAFTRDAAIPTWWPTSRRLTLWYLAASVIAMPGGNSFSRIIFLAHMTAVNKVLFGMNGIS